MGRVKPGKVISGQSITINDDINTAIADFQTEASNVNNFNVRDEALGYEELEDDTFVRNYSYFGGMEPADPIPDFDSQEFPRWRSGSYTTINGSDNFVSVVGGGRPHVRAVNNEATNDVTVVRVSCDIWVQDYGFQTYNRYNNKRWHGPIIRVSLGLNDDIAADATIHGFTELQRTIHWAQLPWSGAKWKEVDPGHGGIVVWNPADGTAFPVAGSHIQNFYENSDGSLQWPLNKFIDRTETTNVMSFCYCFNYQSTYVWQPKGTGTLTGGGHNGVFALMAKVESPYGGGVTPTWGGQSRNVSTSREYNVYVTTEDDDGVETTTLEPLDPPITATMKLYRQSAEFGGLYLRNCEMNSITYTQGR